MDDNWGYPHFRKPPCVSTCLSTPLATLSGTNGCRQAEGPSCSRWKGLPRAASPVVLGVQGQHQEEGQWPRSWKKGGCANVFFRLYTFLTGSQMCMSWQQVQRRKTQTAQEIHVWCCDCKTYCGWVLFNMQHGHNQTGNCGQCTHWANAAYAEKMTSALKAAGWNQ